MRLKLLIFFLCLFALNSFSQKVDSTSTSSSAAVKDTVYANVTEMPEFKGGLQGLYKFLGSKINYPRKARKKGIEGKCFARFVVKSTGKVGKIEIMQGVPNCPECDAEVVRVLKLLPDFKPGLVDGKAVPVWFQIPVSFTLH